MIEIEENKGKFEVIFLGKVIRSFTSEEKALRFIDDFLYKNFNS